MHFNFSVVTSKKLWKKDADAENQQMCKCPDARIVLTMPSRITIMIFVPIRGNTHRGVLFYYGHERRRRKLLISNCKLYRINKCISFFLLLLRRTMEERINMIFVPMRGDTHRGILFFTDTNQGLEDADAGTATTV